MEELPKNPMEIPVYAELWHEAKNDWDLDFRVGMEAGYNIGCGLASQNLANREGFLKGLQIALDKLKS